MCALIHVAVPPGAGVRSGNQVSALRWARLLRQLGHRVRVEPGFAGGRADVLVALHARKNARAVRDFRREAPDRPLVVALTGTDVYGDLPRHEGALRSIELADRLIVLQAEAARVLPARSRGKVRVIHQSALPLARPPKPRTRTFDVAVVGHLRSVKDPLRTALATRGLPAESRIRVVQAGAALSESFERRARAEMARNPRYHWLGELARGAARRLIARSHLLVVSSKMEGGANVIVEAAVDGTPVVASRVSGNVGMLGAAHPGYFTVGRTAELSALLERCERDPRFLADLARRSRRRAKRFDPAVERSALAALLAELGVSSAGAPGRGAR